MYSTVTTYTLLLRQVIEFIDELVDLAVGASISR